MPQIYLPKREAKILEKIVSAFEQANIYTKEKVECAPLSIYTKRPRFEGKFLAVDLEIYSPQSVYPGMKVVQNALDRLVEENTNVVQDEMGEFFLTNENEVFSGTRKILLQRDHLRVHATYKFGNIRQNKVVFIHEDAGLSSSQLHTEKDSL